MNLKQRSKQGRDSLQQGIYVVINPLVRLMIKCGITPNMVTTIGMLGQVLGAALLIRAGYVAGHTGIVPYSLVTWAGVVIILFSLFDMLDGQVARLGNMVSKFGAMYDSVLDRYCELISLGGVTYYFIQFGGLWEALITYMAIIGSLLVSYVRARAEGLGIECKIGFMQRPERVVVTCLGVILTGILGQAGVEWANLVLAGAMTLIAVFANITAAARIQHCRRAMEKMQ
ncbi:MAG: CDP-alcohol phosphatidyltransferase family protein [Muribaculaceae bacterium]|nr:CDP-alcohol phosphatidyltransferase family protein [Muribaculaceae bacterium]MDE6558480.1 CDP-alcohol phosphatidyltransferase family protein [Muribaculaceae bacterium]